MIAGHHLMVVYMDFCLRFSAHQQLVTHYHLKLMLYCNLGLLEQAHYIVIALTNESTINLQKKHLEQRRCNLILGD